MQQLRAQQLTYLAAELPVIPEGGFRAIDGRAPIMPNSLNSGMLPIRAKRTRPASKVALSSWPLLSSYWISMVLLAAAACYA